MRFELRHHIHSDAETFWQVFFCPAYNRELFSPRGLDFQSHEVLLDERPPDGRIHRSLRLEPKVPVPAAIRGLVGPAMAYTETGRFAPETQRWHWTIVPARFGSRADISGSDWLETRPDGEVDRVMACSIVISFPALGRLIERFVEASVRDSHVRATTCMNAWLLQRTT